MKNKYRIVVDTNVIVSAVLLPHSLLRRVFNKIVSENVLLVSEPALAELNEVLCCPKFDKYVQKEKR
jgi:putative PIN family toxin of toxin-antitoxin system